MFEDDAVLAVERMKLPEDVITVDPTPIAAFTHWAHVSANAKARMRMDFQFLFFTV
ncbi:MAG TPA: hypothetical protein VEC19_09485 [Usitatibacter sp.]|nr:hypothetical protein [Usitatibacter sp.]